MRRACSACGSDGTTAAVSSLHASGALRSFAGQCCAAGWSYLGLQCLSGAVGGAWLRLLLQRKRKRLWHCHSVPADAHAARAAVAGLPLWLLMHFQVRSNLRKMLGMPAYNFEDAVALCFCEGCAMCQEMNELQLRELAQAQAQVAGAPKETVVDVPAVEKMAA